MPAKYFTMRERRASRVDALKRASAKVVGRFDEHPGMWGLSDEQPITIHCKLGDWRQLRMALLSLECEEERATL